MCYIPLYIMYEVRGTWCASGFFFFLFILVQLHPSKKDAVEDAGCKVPIAVELDKCTAHTLQIQA